MCHQRHSGTNGADGRSVCTSSAPWQRQFIHWPSSWWVGAARTLKDGFLGANALSSAAHTRPPPHELSAWEWSGVVVVV